MRKIGIVVLTGFVLGGTSVAEDLYIHHMDVGQGDATLITSPTGKNMLIDAGSSGKGVGHVLPYIRTLGVKRLQYIVASHYDADHVGGLDEVIYGLGVARVGTVYDRGTTPPPSGTDAYHDYAAAARAAGRMMMILGKKITLGGGVTLQCVAANGSVLNYGPVGSARGENDLCLAFILSFGKFRYFTGGDCGGDSTSGLDLETPLAPVVGLRDAFKANHHGSSHATNQAFVDTLKPPVGIILVGPNSYGHPAQGVLDRLAEARCKMYLTEEGSGGELPSRSGWVTETDIVITTSGWGTFSVSFDGVRHIYKGHLKDETVYITETGDKYHRGSCRYLSESKIKTTVCEALDKGYTPCKVCKPPDKCT
ncbi:MAG: MBL fold metallo-hydrolase [Acidobacteriota bacterium]